MRSILYAGAALMIGASIYGFIDYKKTSHKKEFSGMYKETKTVTVPDPVKENESDKTETTLESKKIIKDLNTVVTDKGKGTDKKTEIKKKRKFRFSEFSRAPLRDEEKVIIDEQDTKSPDSTKVIAHKNN
jgi:hypothetical protein